KVGLAPIQRDGLDYEFTVVGDMNLNHELIVSKSRCSAIPVGDIIEKPGEKFARTLREWLGSGAPKPAPTPEPVAAALSDAFAVYLAAMASAATLADLDRVATGPGRPARGTPEHARATAAYLARKEQIEKG